MPEGEGEGEGEVAVALDIDPLTPRPIPKSTGPREKTPEGLLLRPCRDLTGRPLLPSTAVTRERPTEAEVDAAFRAAHGRVFARLVGSLRDFDTVEDAMQDAWLRALEHWPQQGIPRQPAAWMTTVARNAVLSAKRHEAVVRRSHDALREAEAELGGELDDDDLPDERLRLLFTCCHPALAEPARVALTLRTVCGLSTPAIARLFLVPEPTVAQRLVRAKRKIRDAAIPYEIPRAARLAERIDDVLACIYLMFTEGHAPTEGALVVRPELCGEAIRLARVMGHAFPQHAEARALLALMLLHHARRHARLDAEGHLVPLEDQDRTRWDAAVIAEGTAALHEALAAGEPGLYALQAAIAALHAQARDPRDTDWSQIAGLYAELLRRAPTPVAALALAYAEGMADGPERGLRCLDELVAAGMVYDDFERLPATRAELLRRAGHVQRARAAYVEAIERARHPREREFLERRMLALPTSPQ
ncbi:MAG: sigma-70 family RNA polymerase sigma factor [Myxococcales bacterium]|nr:sigma-70 family RNA polymerase sigma factor [Myxococcales bacterium]